MELKQEIRSYSLVSPSKTIPDTRPKLAKCIPVFRPKRPQNHTLWGGAYLYVLYKGEHPPPPGKEVYGVDKGYKLWALVLSLETTDCID